MITGFEDWLKKQALRPTTTDLYVRTIHSLTRRYGDNPTMKQLNIFVAARADKRQAYVKYAVKYLLKFLGRSEEYGDIVKVKLRKPIRKRHYYTKEEVRDVGKAIKVEKHRAAFGIQQRTGCRIAEVLTIQPKNTTVEPNPGRKGKLMMKITVIGKGDRPRTIFILEGNLMNWLQDWFEKFPKNAYPFINKDAHKLSKFLRVAKIKTAYNRCLEDLQQAAEACGLEKIGTHDARRTFSENLRRRNIDPKKAKHAGGWSSEEMMMRYWDERSTENDTLEIANEIQTSH